MLAPDTANQLPGPHMADLRDAFGWQLQSHSKKFAHLAEFAKKFPLKIIIANGFRCFVTDTELQKNRQNFYMVLFSLENCLIETGRNVIQPCRESALKKIPLKFSSRPCRLRHVARWRV
jgi:hypothetical protein